MNRLNVSSVPNRYPGCNTVVIHKTNSGTDMKISSVLLFKNIWVLIKRKILFPKLLFHTYNYIEPCFVYMYCSFPYFYRLQYSFLLSFPKLYLYHDLELQMSVVRAKPLHWMQGHRLTSLWVYVCSSIYYFRRLLYIAMTLFAVHILA